MPRRWAGTQIRRRATTDPPIAMVPGIGLLEARDQAQQRGLAAARRPDDRQRGAGLDAEVESVEDRDGPEPLATPVECQVSHARSTRCELRNSSSVIGSESTTMSTAYGAALRVVEVVGVRPELHRQRARSVRRQQERGGQLVDDAQEHQRPARQRGRARRRAVTRRKATAACRRATAPTSSSPTGTWASPTGGSPAPAAGTAARRPRPADGTVW